MTLQRLIGNYPGPLAARVKNTYISIRVRRCSSQHESTVLMNSDLLPER